MIKVLHVLYQSVPDVSGSSTRSKSIVDAQLRSQKILPVVATSPVQKGLGRERVEEIDGVKYYRCYAEDERFGINKKKSFVTKLRKAFSFVGFYREVCRVIKREKPQVIHSHAIFACGLVGLLAARRYKLPFVYEIRSDWHMDDAFDSGSFFQKLFGKLENYLASHANALVVISEGLYEKYGPLNSNPIMVPNGVHHAMVLPPHTVAAPQRAQPVFGFIGSVIPLEGLEFVVTAIARLRAEQRRDVKFLIAGRGEEVERLKKMAQDLHVADLVRFLGAVPFAEVPRVYEQIDVIVNFRRDEPIAHSVTPLKPLEAMAQRKLVIVSSVRGMRELVTDGQTGLVVPMEDVTALARTLARVHQDFASYAHIVETGYQHVVNHRTWDSLVHKYHALYTKLC